MTVAADIVENALLGGRVRLRQPARGYRAGADAVTLAAIVRRGDATDVLAAQVRALGSAGDLLLVLSADAQSPTLLRAVQAAHERDISVLALTGAGGGALARELRDTDVHVSVPSESAAHVHEAHLRALHCVCEGLDQQLLGDEESA